MKKLALIVTFCLIGAGIYAQTKAVNKATQHLNKGELLQAKEQIDLASAHEKTQEKAQTWFTRGQVYEKIAVRVLVPVLEQGISAVGVLPAVRHAVIIRVRVKRVGAQGVALKGVGQPVPVGVSQGQCRAGKANHKKKQDGTEKDAKPFHLIPRS